MIADSQGGISSHSHSAQNLPGGLGKRSKKEVKTFIPTSSASQVTLQERQSNVPKKIAVDCCSVNVGTSVDLFATIQNRIESVHQIAPGDSHRIVPTKVLPTIFLTWNIEPTLWENEPSSLPEVNATIFPDNLVIGHSYVHQPNEQDSHNVHQRQIISGSSIYTVLDLWIVQRNQTLYGIQPFQRSNVFTLHKKTYDAKVKEWLNKLQREQQNHVEDALDFVAEQMDHLCLEQPALVDSILESVSEHEEMYALNVDVLVSLLFFTFPFKEKLDSRTLLLPKVLEKVRQRDGDLEAEKTRKILT
jgi:hypothetical protein